MTTRDAISNSLDGDKLIEEDDLEQRAKIIPTKILDESINISRVKKYFTNSAWKRLQSLLTQVEQENTWGCKTWGKELNKHDLAKECDVCLRNGIMLHVLESQNLPRQGTGSAETV